MIPVIDLFAGPGGLGEGFSALETPSGERPFRVVLSIEKDHAAWRTLALRAFYRQYAPSRVPKAYYDVLRGKHSWEEVLDPDGRWGEGARAARGQAWHAMLGGHRLGPLAESPVAPATPEPHAVSERIEGALGGARQWVLIGGPPCQAYSLVGRARVRGADPVAYEQDHRHFLYQEYLDILNRHAPPVFVMENVKGLLSAKLRGRSTLELIRSDLEALRVRVKGTEGSFRYVLHPFVRSAPAQGLLSLTGVAVAPENRDFVIRSERFGIPQARHRLIILGLREDVARACGPLPSLDGDESRTTVRDAISDLPAVRSQLSKSSGIDTAANWADAIRGAMVSVLSETRDNRLRAEIEKAIRSLRADADCGSEYVESELGHGGSALKRWYRDPRLAGICNHSTRSHMTSDLARYLYAACFARVEGRSPKLGEFPRRSLRPRHRNADAAAESNSLFSDRFRVQVWDSPSTTVTSHISKDGHAFIHPDPEQCRALTVREAARLQTFPDNYLFVGSRTEQYVQVGNAVPPLLARRLAATVHTVLKMSHSGARTRPGR